MGDATPTAASLALYPDVPAERDRWIMARRGPRAELDPEQPYAFLLETERSADGRLDEVATIFLTNRECPWRCAMCDLWRHTLPGDTAPGAIPRQIRYALDRLGRAQTIKLYNSGSFFDPRAIPTVDDTVIAHQVDGFARVIVESHPSFVGERCFALAHRLSGSLEVAMGLETVHPVALDRLNKRMTLDQFAAAAARLLANGVALRSFVLVGVPFISQDETAHWVRRSIDFAFECGATAVSLIPVRGGNGAMEALRAAGEFHAPSFAELEAALDYAISLGHARIFADLWDAARFAPCDFCREQRIARLRRINLTQTPEQRISCPHCAAAA